MKAGRRSLVLVLGLVGGVAACSVATPPIPSPSRGAPASADSSTTPAAATASPARSDARADGRARSRDRDRLARSRLDDCDARGRQRRRGGDLLVRRCGRAWRGGRSGPVALPARSGCAGAVVAKSSARPRTCPDRRRVRYVGIRRHRDPRRTGVGPVAPARCRGGAHPARLAPGRRGGLEPGAELRRPPGTDRLDGVRPRAERPGLAAALRARPGLGARANRGARRRPGRALAAFPSRHRDRVLRGDLLGRISRATNGTCT